MVSAADGAAAEAAAVAAAAAAVAVMVTIKEGNTGEGTLLIITEVEEGDIDVGRELKGEGEDHVPHYRRCTCSDNHPQSRYLDS